jgi:hypothetical protein
MNLHNANLAFQFVRSALNLAAATLPEHHSLLLRHSLTHPLGATTASVLDVLTFPTLFFPTFILLYFG